MASIRSSGMRSGIGNARPTGARALARRALICTGAIAAVLALAFVAASVRRPSTDESQTESAEDPSPPHQRDATGAPLVGGSEAPDGSTDARCGAEDSVTATLGLVPDSDGADVAARLEDLAADVGTTVHQEDSDEEVDVVARSLLGRYQDEGACLLVSAGYLDLLGNVWGCVVEGPGWIDLCIVEKRAQEGSTTRSVRLGMGRGDVR